MLSRAAGIALALGLIAPGAASAQTQGGTIGPPLDNLAPNQPGGCGGAFAVPSCTLMGVDAGGAWSSQTPPGRWVATTARVRSGPNPGPMVIQAVRAARSQAGTPGGVICCSVEAESQVFTPTPNTVFTVPISMPMQTTVEDIDGEPVEFVDYLGVGLLDANGSLPLHFGSGVAGSNPSITVWGPAVRPGQGFRTPGPSYQNATVLVQADLCPAARQGGCSGSGGGTGGGTGTGTGGGGTGTGTGTETPPAMFELTGASKVKPKNGRGKLTFEVSGAGELELTDAKEKKPRLKTTSATATGAGELELPLRLTKQGKKALKKQAKKGRKLKLRANATFTQPGGQPQTGELTLKLRGKGRKRR